MSGDATLRTAPPLSPASERRIERQRDEAAFRERLGVKAGRLFLHSSKRAAEHQRRELAGARILRPVQVASKNDPKPVPERHLSMDHAIALREHLVPSTGRFRAASAWMSAIAGE
jgi:hypothetical protein